MPLCAAGKRLRRVIFDLLKSGVVEWRYGLGKIAGQAGARVEKGFLMDEPNAMVPLALFFNTISQNQQFLFFIFILLIGKTFGKFLQQKLDDAFLAHGFKIRGGRRY